MNDVNENSEQKSQVKPWSERPPEKGDVVFFCAPGFAGYDPHGGSSVVKIPAVVTHVWDGGSVNLFVFPDGSYRWPSGPKVSVSRRQENPPQNRYWEHR